MPEDDTVRSTRFGQVKGIEAAADTWAWLGVPYAKPPLGTLRWKAPQEPDPWEGQLTANQFGSICPQYGNIVSETGEDSLGRVGEGRVVGNEDCLYLNIWRPRTAETGLPVFVFIHGGSNIQGRSDLTLYDGANFATQANMVFVTMNYRLGTLGWFAHPSLRTGHDRDDSGNFGTLDIIASLEWIRDNIEAFGGNPDKVTLSGQSAGGVNTYSLLASPLAAGLFHRALPMSGFPFSIPMSLAEQRAETVMTRLLNQDEYVLEGDRVLDSGGALRFDSSAAYLRSKTLEELYPPESMGSGGMIMDGGPLGFFTSMGVYEDGFVMPRSSLQCLKSGEQNLVPMMFGCTSEEWKMMLLVSMAEPERLWNFYQEFDPDNPEFHLEDMLPPTQWPLLMIHDSLAALGQVLFKTYGVDNTARILSTDQDVYVYEFAWDEEPEPLDFLIGAGHGMDIPFAFGNFKTDRNSVARFAWSQANREAREELSEAMMTFYAQFARTGDPNTPDSDLPQWTPWSNDPGAPKRIIFDTEGPYMSIE